MKYSKLQKPYKFNDYLKNKMKIKIRKISWIWLKKNDRVRHFFLLNSANVPLLLSTLSVVDTKIEKLNKSGRYLCWWLFMYNIPKDAIKNEYHMMVYIFNLCTVLSYFLLILSIPTYFKLGRFYHITCFF